MWYHAFKKFICFSSLAVWGASSMLCCWYNRTLCTYAYVPSPGTEKCLPCVDRVLIKGFWTYWLKETMVTKLLSYFCSLTKVFAIHCDLFGPCAVGHAIHSGLERIGRGGGGEKGMLAQPCCWAVGLSL